MSRESSWTYCHVKLLIQVSVCSTEKACRRLSTRARLPCPRWIQTDSSDFDRSWNIQCTVIMLAIICVQQQTIKQEPWANIGVLLTCLKTTVGARKSQQFSEKCAVGSAMAISSMRLMYRYFEALPDNISKSEVKDYGISVQFVGLKGTLSWWYTSHSYFLGWQ